MLRAEDFRKEAWAKLSNKWGLLALITLIYVAIEGACSSLAAVGVGAVVMLLIMGPLALGYAIVSLTIIRMQETKVEQLFQGFQNFVNAFVLGLLNQILIALWSMLFVIPGIVKAISYSMSYYILADHPEMAPNDARKASMKMMNGNKWRYFCLQVSFIGWYILGALTFGILYLWVIPYNNAANAAFYESIKGATVSGQPVEESAPAIESSASENN